MEGLPSIIVDRSSGRVWAIAALADGSGGAFVTWDGKAWVPTSVVPNLVDDLDIVKGSRAEGIARSLIGDGPIDSLKAGLPSDYFGSRTK